jgi:hypothetical protein
MTPRARLLKELNDQKGNKMNLHEAMYGKRKPQTLEEIKSSIQDVLKIQGADGNWNYESYMHGMYNGMVLIDSILRGIEPVFKEEPEQFICDVEVTSKDIKAALGNLNTEKCGG